MAITIRRRANDFDTDAALARLHELRDQLGDQFGPAADQARANAERGLHRARGWTAPRLHTAALRVEDTYAPRVSDALHTAARRVEPNAARRGLMAARQGRRRIPRAVLFGGAAALGALALYGAVRLRRAAQDAEWQENLDQAREQVRETKEQLADKAKSAAQGDAAADGAEAGSDGSSAASGVKVGANGSRRK
ncbi:hypothetical protein [Nocardiopsis coralliicola]